MKHPPPPPLSAPQTHHLIFLTRPFPLHPLPNHTRHRLPLHIRAGILLREAGAEELQSEQHVFFEEGVVDEVDGGGLVRAAALASNTVGCVFGRIGSRVEFGGKANARLDAIRHVVEFDGGVDRVVAVCAAGVVGGVAGCEGGSSSLASADEGGGGEDKLLGVLVAAEVFDVVLLLR